MKVQIKFKGKIFTLHQSFSIQHKDEDKFRRTNSPIIRTLLLVGLETQGEFTACPTAAIYLYWARILSEFDQTLSSLIQTVVPGEVP